jgi:ribosomal silencing factor RsfS
LKKVYGLTVVVAKSSNTKLSVLTVNGNPVNEGDEITLPARTTSAVVKAVAEDPEAKILTSGASDLVAGYNYASVTVIAPDRSVSTIWWFFKVLELSSDNSVSSIQVNGASYVNETVVELPLGTSQVAVSAIANDSGAKVAVSGNTNLVGGLNTITVSVTAANGDVKKYEAYVNVPVRSGNAEISSAAGTWLINGIDVSNQDTVVDLPAGTSAITASAKTADSKATMAITGATKLIAGVNTVTFTVTAENGTQKTYTRYVNVKALSGNANLKYITVAGQNVVGGSQVLVPAGTSRVEVIPVLESDEARFTVAGNTNLVQGSNTVTVVVTAPNGTTSISTITVVVATPPSDTTLKTFTVNGKAVSAGDVFVVAAGTSRVSVSAIVNDSKASVTISGKSSLKAGDNLLIVKVTALSGDSTTYAVTLRVGK